MNHSEINSEQEIYFVDKDYFLPVTETIDLHRFLNISIKRKENMADCIPDFEGNLINIRFYVFVLNSEKLDKT